MESYVRFVLPKLSEDQLARALRTLDELGVEEQSDLDYIEESDLLKALKPVQARKLLRSRNSGINNFALISSTACSSQPAISHAKPETPTTSIPSLAAELYFVENPISPQPDPLSPSANPPAPQDWAYQFEIPWHKFPPALVTMCRQNLRPDPCHRKEMIRILVDEILLITRRPGRKNLDRIAYKIVSQYPDSFRDGIDGVIMGEGHSSLTNQLLNRLENTMRKAKRLGYPPMNAKKEEASKRKSAGCANWSGDSDDSRETMHWQKLCLIEEFEKSVRDKNMIYKLMKDTFTLQREEIKEHTPMKTIQADWPFLLEKECLLSHYNTLVGKEGNKNEFMECFFSRALSVYRALKTCNQIGMSDVINRVKDECRSCGNDGPKAARLPDLLASYFKEDASYIYRTFEEDTDIDKIFGLPSTPIVVVLGLSPTTARTHYVCMKNVAICKFQSFLDALAYAFCCFYVFKILFPDGAMVTFEFLQRYFAGINSLAERGPRKKSRHQVHPKVLSLTKRIMLSQQSSSGSNIVDAAAVSLTQISN